MLQKTTAQKKIAALKGRYRIVQGGTSSSKTFTIIPFLIDYAIKNKGSEISVVSESLPHLKRGAIKDFLKIMEWTGMYIDSQYNKSGGKYTFGNGSYIEFFSADSPDKMRGARRHILFVNEANNIDYETFNQLAIRTSKFIYIDYNPTSEFWAHTEIMNDADASHVILTYKDNEALDQTIVNELEKAREKAKTSAYWDNWWRVYGLGLTGNIQGLVFHDWSICKDIPEDARYLGSGLDFGFTNDPTAVVDVWQQSGELYVREAIYETGLMNPMIATKLKQDPKYNEKYIIADSAEPKSIAELSAHGIKVIKCPAKDTSLSIDILKRYKINITQDSLNLIKEFRSYKWLVDKKTNETLNQPVDFLNHAIDALRYFALHYLKKGGGVKAIDY